MKKLARMDALAMGAPRYFTGIACKYGHIAERRTADWGCVLCKRANSSKHRLLKGQIPWSKSDEERRARRSEALRRYAKAHPDRLREAQRKYKEAHPERPKQIKRKWAKANPDAVRLKHHRRRARKVGTVSKDIIQRLTTAQRGRCANCRVSGIRLEVDHVVPLAGGGLHADENLQLLCGDCNRSKCAKDPIRWAQEQGRLL